MTGVDNKTINLQTLSVHKTIKSVAKIAKGWRFFCVDRILYLPQENYESSHRSQVSEVLFDVLRLVSRHGHRVHRTAVSAVHAHWTIMLF